MENEKILSNEELLNITGGDEFVDGKELEDATKMKVVTIHHPYLLYAIPPILKKYRGEN